MEEDLSKPSLAEENCRLREELSQCKDDKDFVWMLWKDLQKQNPDMTSTVDMIITREALKSEQVTKELQATVQVKHQEAMSLANELEEKKRELLEQNAKLSRIETEVALLEDKLKSQQLTLQKETDEAQVMLMKMEEVRTELESKLEQQRSAGLATNEELKRILLNHDEQQRKCEKLKMENNTKDLLIQHLEGEVVHLKQRVEDLSQQRVEHDEILHRQQAELQSAKNELTEVGRSRDAWASHTTLQSTAIQQLQRENNHLKVKLSKKNHRESRENVDMEGSSQKKEKGESVRKSQDFLESTEKELFETRLQLQAKCAELESLRSSHDRRMKRMNALQTSHKLLEEQLQTYEANSSETPNNQFKHKRIPVKALRHENSSAVWNELALYRERCQLLETHLLELEEERDTLKAKCLRSQSSIAELRTRLQHEKNDLERKLSAIARAEEASNTASSELHELQQKVSELEGVISELRNEKATLESEHSTIEKECFKLREDAAQMQTKIIELSHKMKLQHIEMLSKATMTDKGSPCHQISISVTDSATQVDCSPSRPDVRDAQVSPIKPLNTPSSNVRDNRENDTETSNGKHLRSHRRTCSEGDSLFYKNKAKAAFSRVKKISKQLQDMSFPQDSTHHSSTAIHSGKENCPLNTLKQSSELTCRAEGASEKTTAPHKCAFQQQMKPLQRKVRALSKQLATSCTTRQWLSQSLEEEKRERNKARAEVKELTVRLQGMKTVVQSLQGEVHRVSAINQQFQQKLTSLAETKRGRAETDWKRQESEKQVLNDRCSSLSESVKRLEEKLQQKTSEQEETQDRCSRMERDLRQKRQLLDAQRDKMRTLTQQAADNQTKVRSMEGDLQGMKESVDQSRHRVETLRMQLSRQTEEKLKVMKSLASTQEELAKAVQQLCASQNECEKQKQLLVKVRQSCEQEVEGLRLKHAETVESSHKKHSERVELIQEQLRKKERFLNEHRLFVKKLADGLEQHVASQRKRELPNEKKHSEESCNTVSTRVREIAKSTLHFSDLDVDQFFFDSHKEQQVKYQVCQLSELVESKLSELPFANNLVQIFLNVL